MFFQTDSGISFLAFTFPSSLLLIHYYRLRNIPFRTRSRSRNITIWIIDFVSSSSYDIQITILLLCLAHTMFISRWLLVILWSEKWKTTNPFNMLTWLSHLISSQLQWINMVRIFPLLMVWFSDLCKSSIVMFHHATRTNKKWTMVANCNNSESSHNKSSLSLSLAD